MKRRLIVAIGMSALMMAWVLPGTTAAAPATAPATRFGKVDTSQYGVTTANLLSQRDPNRMVNAYVELKASPVATYVGAALANGTSLTESQKDALRQPLMAAQTTLSSKLRLLGAVVEGNLTDVLNAVKVRVSALTLPKIQALPGVKSVSIATIYHVDNTNTVPYIGADTTWTDTGFTGAGVKIAIIDTGINFFHRDFGGTTGYATATGLSASHDHFPTAKVVGGWDFVGDAYDPASSDPSLQIPHPDNDPLDCKDPAAANVQHGTHVAGTAAGEGVNADGTTYTGPYTAAAEAGNSWSIGPGVAPQASLMAYRVFGCSGATDIVIDAIERAVRDGANVINMSLGSPYGDPGSADSEAVDNASIAGVTVVMAAGNEGPSAYETGSPGVATRGISVAAMDAVPSFPSINIHLPSGPDITAINANNNTTGLPITGPLNVFKDDPSTPFDGNTNGIGDEALGCNPQDYTYNGWVAGEIPVAVRGYCARIQRAIEATSEGASTVIMINNAASLPPYEGPITGATIPFAGVNGTDGPALVAADTDSATLSVAPTLANPDYPLLASFSSGGPSGGASALKPDVAAPGVSVMSADGSTIKGGKILSGTSMASPATAGAVALIVQAHPTWTPEAIKAALIGTAQPNLVVPLEGPGSTTRNAGAGVVQPRLAVDTKSYVVTNPGTSSLSFGDVQLNRGVAGPGSYVQTLPVNINNTSGAAITYDLSNAFSTADMGFTVAFSQASVTVPAHSKAHVNVTLSLSEADVAALPDVAPFHSPNLAVDADGQLYSPLTNVAGAITVHPETAGAGQYDLRVPWLVAPRGQSDVTPTKKTANVPVAGGWTTNMTIKNNGLHEGDVDTYAWGLLDGREGVNDIDLRAGGVQSDNPLVCSSTADPSDRCLVFAINTWGKWNNPSTTEFDTLIDTNNDGIPDFDVIGTDAFNVLGALNGVYVSAVLDLSTGNIVDIYFATAPNNGDTVLLPVLASDLGLTGTGRFDYMVESFDVQGNLDVMTTSQGVSPSTGWARFFAFDEPIENGDFAVLAPGQSMSATVHVAAAHLQPRHGMQGWMVVALEDKVGGVPGGQTQADLIPLGHTP